MTLGEVITVAIALLSLVLSLIVGIPALVRAGRAEALATSAKKRADRIKARETERHDADWEFKFRGGDLTVLEISNTGADDALGVIVIAGIDGVRVFEEREVVRGRARSRGRRCGSIVPVPSRRTGEGSKRGASAAGSDQRSRLRGALGDRDRARALEQCAGRSEVD